jgi:hypothetical protein
MFLAAVFLKEGFFTGTLGLAIAFTPLATLLECQTPVEDFGVPLGAFEKKLRIDPFLVDPVLESCFFKDGGAGVTSAFSFFDILRTVASTTVYIRVKEKENQGEFVTFSRLWSAKRDRRLESRMRDADATTILARSVA